MLPGVCQCTHVCEGGGGGVGDKSVLPGYQVGVLLLSSLVCRSVKSVLCG